MDFIKPPLRIAFRAVSRLNLMREYRYVFVLAHMRSGSTLLSHILANHPDFAGAGETHIVYKTVADLPKLVLTTSELLHRPILRETYLVDQINHAYVSDDVLLSDDLYRCIILVRKPEATLQSLAALRHMKSLPWRERPALDYYVDRLETLTRYGSILGKRALLVEYDDLIDHTDATLSTLTSFLEIAPPLTPNYATHRMTGHVAGIGDPSANIKIGHLIRTPKHDVILSDETRAEAKSAFSKCRDKLRVMLTSPSS